MQTLSLVFYFLSSIVQALKTITCTEFTSDANADATNNNNFVVPHHSYSD